MKWMREVRQVSNLSGPPRQRAPRAGAAVTGWKGGVMKSGIQMGTAPIGRKSPRRGNVPFPWGAKRRPFTASRSGNHFVVHGNKTFPLLGVRLRLLAPFHF